MRIPRLRVVSGAVLLMMACEAGAADFGQIMEQYRQAVRQGKTTHELDIDNDSLLFNGNDGFYTSGLGYTKKFVLDQSASRTVFGWRIGQQLFTASDIKLPPSHIARNDHPYAGWLYGGFFQEVFAADGTYRKAGIDVGCLGSCAGGEWTQRTLHRILNQPLPQGWSTQLRNEFGVVLHAEQAPVSWKLGNAADLTPAVRARFGNIFTDAAVSLTLRAGRLPDFPGNRALYGFVRLDGRAVAYNATLQGGYFRNDDARTVSPRRFVGEAEGGIAWREGPYGISASIVRTGNEIRGIPDSIGSQNFVRLGFSYTP